MFSCSCPFPRTSFSLMLRSGLLLCSSRPSWALRADNGLLGDKSRTDDERKTPSYSDLHWYGTKDIDEMYASLIPHTEGGEAVCFCKEALCLVWCFLASCEFLEALETRQIASISSRGQII